MPPSANREAVSKVRCEDEYNPLDCATRYQVMYEDSFLLDSDVWLVFDIVDE